MPSLSRFNAASLPARRRPATEKPTMSSGNSDNTEK